MRRSCWLSVALLVALSAPLAWGQIAFQPAGGRSVKVPDELPDTAGQPVDGLKLTAAFEPAALVVEPLQLRRALEDAPRFNIEQPAELKLTFENVGDKPIKLNAYSVTDHLNVAIDGPSDKAVRAEMVMLNRMMKAMEPSDFPTLAPGKSWTATLRFPGYLGMTRYQLLATGLYRVAFTYSNQARPQQQLPEFAAGAWQGRVVSSVAELTVIRSDQFGKADSGLQLGLTSAVDTVAADQPARVAVVLRNSSDKPVLMMPLLVANVTVELEVVGPDGQPRKYSGPMPGFFVDYDKAVRELAPGQVVHQLLSLSGFDLSKPGRYQVTATYQWSSKQPPGRQGQDWKRGAIWTGKIQSAPAFFTVGDNKAGPVGEVGLPPQGIRGKAVKLSGNFMPGPPGLDRGNKRPLSVPVWIFRGKVKADTAPDRDHPQLVQVVQADKQGQFNVALPPGEYTVVAEIGGKLYLNILSGSGHWATVNVEAGKWTNWTIEESSEAAY